MKNILLVFVFGLLSHLLYSQSPMQFNYQAVARDNRGVPLSQADIRMRFSIRNESPNGTVEYMEIRKVQTNQFGMFSIGIGSEGAFFSTGTLKDVKWESGKKYLQAEMDIRGVSRYVDLGATQLVSVPYALFALKTLDKNNSVFSGIAGNGLSIEDSTVQLGGKEKNERSRFTSNRIIPLNGYQLQLIDSNSIISFGKESISIQQDSAFNQGDNINSGGTFLKSNPIFPRPDAVPFVFNRVANQQHNRTVSPNEVVTWGHNIGVGGGPLISGLPGIGYSLESNYKPDPDARWVESHEFYITPQGRQVRLKSYTIDTKSNWIDFYHSTDNFYIKNPRNSEVYFSLGNFGQDNNNQQLVMGLWHLDINKSNKQLQFTSNIPNAELYFTQNWGLIHFPGLLIQGDGLHRHSKNIIAETDNQVDIGGTGNRFANVFSVNYGGSRMVLRDGWAPYETFNATATLDIEGMEGFNQFRMRKTYTPTSSTDTNGNVGDMAWDKDFLYIKTEEGWKRTSLVSF